MGNIVVTFDTLFYSIKDDIGNIISHVLFSLKKFLQ